MSSCMRNFQAKYLFSDVYCSKRPIDITDDVILRKVYFPVIRFFILWQFLVDQSWPCENFFWRSYVLRNLAYLDWRSLENGLTLFKGQSKVTIEFCVTNDPWNFCHILFTHFYTVTITTWPWPLLSLCHMLNRHIPCHREVFWQTFLQLLLMRSG